MKQDLITLAEQFPGITVSVQLSDLLTAGRTLKDEILEELRDFAYGQNLYVLYAKFPPPKAKRLQLVVPQTPQGL